MGPHLHARKTRERTVQERTTLVHTTPVHEVRERVLEGVPGLDYIANLVMKSVLRTPTMGEKIDHYLAIGLQEVVCAAVPSADASVHLVGMLAGPA